MPPSPKEAETVTEWRVVGDRYGFNVTCGVSVGPTYPTAQEARAALAATNPVGFDVVYKNLRIQSRTVTTTPWEDVTEANQQTKGEH